TSPRLDTCDDVTRAGDVGERALRGIASSGGTRGGRRMLAKRVAIASLLLAVAAACHHGAFTNTPAGTQGAVALVVQNQNFYDMDLYVVSEGLATRIGDVTGNTTARFTLDPSFFPS